MPQSPFLGFHSLDSFLVMSVAIMSRYIVDEDSNGERR